MAYELWSSSDLYEVLEEVRGLEVNSYWLNKFFPRFYASTKEEIMFDRVTNLRRVAPFSLPTEQGKPIYRQPAEVLESFKPAYIKLLDAVRPTEEITRRPRELFRGNEMTLEERMDMRVTDIVKFHVDAIRRQWNLMGARSAMYAKLTIRYRRDGEPGDGPPEVTIDFNRNANHTVVYTSGADWSNPDYPIIDDIQKFADRMRIADFGGNMNEVLLGAAVVPYFRKNKQVLALADVNVRTTHQIAVNNGLITFNDPANPEAEIMTLNNGVVVKTYNEHYENDNGTAMPIMDPKGVLFSAPGVEGVKAFGAIYDLEAAGAMNGLNGVDIFPKMYDQPNPSARFILHQSAPLMIPVNPNRTLFLRAIA